MRIKPRLKRFEVADHFCQGIPAVGDGVFGIFINFGEGAVGIGIGDEYRVVAEAASAGTPESDASLALPFK
jgi:hypothetical protein